ncbi:MAG: dihydrodipicolinate synthase family protein, partial [Caldilineaceae bacterium]
FGTTSEANSFSVAERTNLLEQLVNAGLPAAQMIVGVGCNAVPDTAALTAHAVTLGAGGVLMLPPFYYKDVTDEGIFRSVAEVIERVADDRLRVYLYHIPPIAQVGFSLDLIERLVSMFPQTVVGIKDSSGNEATLDGILGKFFGFGTFAGSERLLLKTLRGGGAGTITAMANIIPGEIRRLYDNWQKPEADQIQADVNALRDALKGYPLIPALKRVVADLRQDPDWAHVRAPLVALNQEQAAALRSRLPLLSLA